ncbi:hypothetical protein VOLCADRAFT_107073 [Volvox carteri f. nagariensis]|uniref:Sec39 domain-containing protein n=1 Tax=Volvox carteri f. nagariensis TaxID=3068 RepID=D8UBU4_VOLCA|nr:uncharacterized protein VOLCADRAFT_107073 [Volvox carteri f. nagariensis]EFJ42827.1 hypothetical protein VOLCADRAFT_107073 [Volvox carteri f. nagariensis]|eukprot:XP_002956087.1 hypothetical protein VOLCADRAFT_107073 [Volvox carteri f. nagariensis]
MQQSSNSVLYEELEQYTSSSNGRAIAGLLSQKRRYLSDQADGSRLAVACASRHIYILDRSGQPVSLLSASAGPWTAKPVGALAMPLPTTLLILTGRPSQLFIVPLDAPPRVLQGLRPQQLSRQCDTVRVAAYDARTSTLVVAGESGPAGGGKGPAAAGARVSVSTWRLEVSGPGAAAAAATKAVPLGSFVGSLSESAGAGGSGPAAATVTAAAAWARRRWTLSLSPLGEHVAIVAPPAPGVLILSVPQCRREDPGERFGGRTAPPASAFRTTLTRSVESAASASWWGSETALALSDMAGYVGLAQLPGYDNLLAGDEQPKYAPGTLVASKSGGPGTRGLLVLEPLIPPESKIPGSGGVAAADGVRSARASRGAAASAEAAAAASAAAAPGLRLLLLAQRTPEEMLQVHMRHQQWGRALELCAAAGLNADRVYGARWASRPVDAANIADNLAKIADRRWVVGECCRRVASDYEGQRKLINYGLRETARQAKPPAAADSVDDASSNASAPGGAATAAAGGSGERTDPRDTAWWWCTRLKLWRHSDRLEVLYAAQGRTFNPSAYAAFRDLSLAAAAGSWAATGALGPLAVLAQHYPASLSGPVLLGVLSRLPETINPRLYSALLPRPADGEEVPVPLRPPPVRKQDWVEQPEVLAEIRKAVAAGSGSGSGSAVDLPDWDPEATDALVRVLAPRPRLSAAAASEWYAERALQLDEETGQLQGALALLELGWERGARGPRVAQLLGAAMALTSVISATTHHHRASLAAGSASSPGGVLWRLRLGDFAEMPGAQQLRLLLAGSDEDSLRQDLRERFLLFGFYLSQLFGMVGEALSVADCGTSTRRVVPFLRGPGWDAARVGPLLGALMAEEMAARPAWAAALVEAEARDRMLFESTEELVQAVTSAVAGCPHTDEWPSLERAMAAVEAAASEEAAAAAAAGETSAEAATATAAARRLSSSSESESCGGWLAGLRELRGFVRAGSLLAARGLPLTVRHVSSCGREEAARCIRQVLGRLQRSSPSMPDAAWSQLWLDLVQVRSAAFPFLEPQELLSEVARCMLHCGRNDLANAYLHGGAPGETHVALEPEAADALITSVAAEILAGANDPWDSAAQQSAACLALASPDAPPAVALRRLVSALQMLPELGLDVIPAQVMQMTDRFEVIRLILEGSGNDDGGGGLLSTAGATSAAGGVGFGSTLGLAASAALGGKLSRRRAAVRAAGQAAVAGGRAAAALAGGLLAVAGRVAGANVAEAVAGRMAPMAGIVAGAVAATVSAAAAAAPTVAHGGTVQPPYKQVGRLLELAELLGLDSPDDELRLKDLAGTAALRAGDLATAQHLALELLAARYMPAWSLCAELGSKRQLQDDVVREQLLSYALLHCPAERMTRLLEELRAVERPCWGEAGWADGSDPLLEAPEYLLREALLAPGQRAAAASPGAAATAHLPLPGDTHLALAVLEPGTATGSAGRAIKLLEGLRGGGGSEDGSGSGGGAGLPYAQLQRVAAMECYCHCLRALLPAAGSGAERLRLLEQPLGELLQRVRQLGTTPASMSDATADAAAAALAAEARLAAARDSRTVRQHLPGVDAAQFASGGDEYRRQAILQQAALAGKAEAEAPGAASPRAAELMEQARQLAAAYGVDPWDVELHFMSALITDAVAVTAELRAAVQSREPGLLQRPKALLRHLATATYPVLPTSSGPHLALWLAVLTDCLHACAKDDPATAALTASIAPILGKLRDLLEKAAAALKGLSLTQLHAPLLAPLLAPLGVTLAGPAASAAATAPADAAAAAIFSYVKPSNLAQAAKLVTALHKLLGPPGKKAAAAGPGSGTGLLFPDLQRALDSLPPSLPYLCLCVKAVGTKSGGQQQQQHQQQQRDMAVAWSHVEEHVVRLPPAQLAAWLAFLLLPGSQCPLCPGVTGAQLAPCPCPVDVRLVILDTCMPRLQSPHAASMTTQPAAAEASIAAAHGDNAAAACAVTEVLRRLRSLHRRLLMLRAAKQHAADGLDAQQLKDLEYSLLSADDPTAAASASSAGGADAAAGAVRLALSSLAAAGCPAAVLLDIAAVAAEPQPLADGGGTDATPGSAAVGPAAAAVALLESAVGDTVGSALSALLDETGESTTAAGLARLKGALRCLDRPQDRSSNPTVLDSGVSADPADAKAEDLAHTLRVLRDRVWRDLQRFTDERLPSLERLRPSAASELLDMQAALGTRVMWSDWATSGGHSDDAGKHRQRLLLTRTRALLAHLVVPASPSPPSYQLTDQQHHPAAMPMPTVQLDDLTTLEAAERLFTRVLQAVQGGAGGGWGGTASLTQLRQLACLLTDIWQDGDMWSQSQDAASGSGGGSGVAPAAEGKEEEEAAAAGRVSLLHGCWRELAAELLRCRQLLEVVSLLDPPGLDTIKETDSSRIISKASCGMQPGASSLPSLTGRPLPLSPEDVQQLIHASANGADGAAASWCLGLASPYKIHREQALKDLEAASSDGGGPIPCDIAVLLLAFLVRSEDAAQLGTSQHPLLARLVGSVPASPAQAVAAAAVEGRDAAAMGCVLPCLLALLVERQQCGLAAALVSRRLRLHPALASAGGSMLLLERYLKAEAACDGDGSDRPERAGGARGMESDAGRGDQLLGCLPAAVDHLRCTFRERCRRALRVLTAAAAVTATANTE